MTQPPEDPLRKQPDEGAAGYPPPPHHGQATGGFPPPPGFQPAPELSVGSALSYGWSKFSGDLGSWLLIALVSFVVGVLLYLTSYALTFAIDRDDRFGTAFSNTFRLTTQHAAKLLPLAIVCALPNVVGALLCLVGLLVSAAKDRVG